MAGLALILWVAIIFQPQGDSDDPHPDCVWLVSVGILNKTTWEV